MGSSSDLYVDSTPVGAFLLPDDNLFVDADTDLRVAAKSPDAFMSYHNARSGRPS